MNPDLLPLELQPVITRFNREVSALMQRLQDGMIAADEWHNQMRQLLARYHIQAMLAGTGTATLPNGATELLGDALDFQDEYLSNFKMVIESAGEFSPAWIARAGSYVGSIKVPYWEGKVYRDVGRFLPLPAMPAQGTTCHNNCGCNWDIQTLDESSGDYDAYWRRGLTDSCQVCIERERQWNPVRIRGGDLQL